MKNLVLPRNFCDDNINVNDLYLSHIQLWIENKILSLFVNT